jgi:hypothetical protein
VRKVAVGALVALLLTVGCNSPTGPAGHEYAQFFGEYEGCLVLFCLQYHRGRRGRPGARGITEEVLQSEGILPLRR